MVKIADKENMKIKWQVKTLKGKIIYDNLSLPEAEIKSREIRKLRHLCYISRKK